jgi:hypothetical protein
MLGATLKTIAIGLCAFLIMYFLINNNFHLKKTIFPIRFSFFEGLENMEDKTTVGDNEAAASTSFVAALKAKTIQMQDELLIGKYRKQYEDAIINMDDYAGFLMMKEILNTKMEPENFIKTASNLNTLRTLKDSLNATMKFLDTVN